MTLQRLSPTQILTDVPLEAAREAVWYGLRDAGVSNVVIDRDKNVVVGSTGASLSTYGQNITATLVTRAEGVSITLKSEAQVQGSIDFGKSKRHAKSVADAVENSLRQGERPREAVVETGPLAPIAAPTGELATGASGPIYGVALPPKRGTVVLIYGLLGISCCQIAAPFAWFYGSRALREYGVSDPGDKTIVRIGWVLGILGTIVLVARLGFYAYSFATGGQPTLF